MKEALAHDVQPNSLYAFSALQAPEDGIYGRNFRTVPPIQWGTIAT